MKIKRLCYLFLLMTGLHSFAQRKVTISGTLTSKAKGETLIGASIRASRTGEGGKEETSGGATTNQYGFFSLSLAPGTYQVEISSVGLENKILSLDLRRDTTLNIALADEATSLSEVTVTATTKRRSLSSPQMGLEHVSTSDIKNIPVLLGERDPIKVITLLPGIKSAGEGNTGFNVRGGAADQNLILLDEAPVYNASHLLGFFSTFNSDAIKDINVYKAGMPAEYGGRLSSVLDITMNDGNKKDYDVSGGVGLISAKLNVEGPIQQDKSSFLISARRTYVDLFTKLSKDSTINSNKLYFYDLNAKLNYIIGAKDRLYLSGYFGQDELGVGQTFGLDWGNGTGTLRWNHIFSNKLFSNTSLIFSNYNYKIIINSGGYNLNIFSQIRDWNIKEELQWYVGSRHTLHLGVNSIYHTIRPGEVTPNSDSSGINASILQRRHSLENAAYISDTWKATDNLNITYGGRLTGFSILGGDFYNIDGAGHITDTLHYAEGTVVKTYLNFEPRVAASLQLNATTSIKASYVRNVQNLHLLSNSTSSNPTDKWVASTNIIKPEISDQTSIGYYKNLPGNMYELTVEAYYKSMQNQIDYRDGADVFSNTNAIESELLFGKGRAYGLEWLFRKRTGRLTGWISYTLSKTEKKIDGINDDQWYNATQDRTHDIAIVSMYKLNKKWSLSANWVYNTGNAVSFPAGKYKVGDQLLFYYTNRNGYRMPAYHRLDLGATCQLKQKKKFSSELAFSLYNAYGRQNAYVIEFQQDPDNANKTQVVRTALFSVVPSISYNFKF